MSFPFCCAYQTIEVPGDKYILEAAEEANLALPYDCRFGSCVTCGGRIESGTVDQTDQIFLSDELIDQVRSHKGGGLWWWLGGGRVT